MGWSNAIGLGLGAVGAGASIAGTISGKNARERAERQAQQLQDRLLASISDAGTVTPADREAIESQFGRARESTIAGTPARGGQLVKALADLDTERARTVGTLGSAKRMQALGFAVPALSGGVSNFTNIANAAAARETASAAGLGQMAAMATIMALKQGKK